LLKRINALPGDFWISFISNHPKDFSDELIKNATKLPKVCEFIHLPLQAGDNQILQKMNRKYTHEKYLKIVDKIKESFKKYKPGALYSLTSDIIVGFPGETKKQFFESGKVMKKVGFDMVYFGQYSPRPGTAAYKLKDSVSKTEKSRREKYLNEILKKSSWTNNQKYLGKTLEVLIEKEASIEASIESSKKTYFGRTRTMKNVKIISTRKNLIGKIIKAKIIKANIWNLEGKY
jgi:tRNA-2-methylthio-N6-dimethylallyladenosine synthase